MKAFDDPLTFAAAPEVLLSCQSPSSVTTTPEWTTSQKFLLILVAILSTFAVGSSPIVFAFINSPIDNQVTTETLFSGGNMF